MTVRSIDHKGTEYVPFKDMVAAYSGTIEWDNEAKTAQAYLGGRHLVIRMADEQVEVDGQMVRADAPPFVKDDTLYVPASLMRTLNLAA